MPIVLITGATSGIGMACAHVFAQHGYQLIITGRRSDRLTQLAVQLISQFNGQVQTCCFDVRDADASRQALESLPTEWQSIDVLVNNAGLSRGLEPISEGHLEDWNEMIDTNIKGLLHITRIVSPWMVERKKGHIINVGSTAAKQVYPGGNVYCATKFAVQAITDATRIDLVHQGIKVSAIHPGYVETEFSIVRFHGDEKRAEKVYEGFKPLSGNDVAEVIYWMASCPPHVNPADVVLLPDAQGGVGIVRKNLVSG
jgi:3-hydroxy acid dehydrogenase / malonic semialdehyde reductase